MKVLIFIPAKNEGENIGKVIVDIREEETEWEKLDCEWRLEIARGSCPSDFKWKLSTSDYNGALREFTHQQFNDVNAKLVSGGQGYLVCIELSDKEKENYNKCQELNE